MFLNIIRRSSSAAAIKTRNTEVRKYLDKQFKDAYSKLAREHSFRARSAFKLMEIDERFGVFQPGLNVLDIGAAPGSWCQVALLKVQPDGYVLGVDLQIIQPLKGVEFLHKADITDPLVQQAIVKRLAGRKIDCVLSDMAPSPTGSKEIDHIRIVELCRTALNFVSPDSSADPSTRIALGDTARFICKIWDGPLRDELSREISKVFGKVRTFKPDSSRDHSAEMTYLSKQYLRLAAKWPVDKHKNQARNYRYFLEKQIAVICGLNFEKFEPHRDDKPPINPELATPAYHDANLRALRELTNNEHHKRWPSEHYKTGIFGLTSSQLHEVNSEAFRKNVGFSKSRWQTIKSLFWR